MIDDNIGLILGLFLKHLLRFCDLRPGNSGRIGLRSLAISSLSRADVASRTVCSCTHRQDQIATVRYFGLLSVFTRAALASAVPAVAPCPSVRLSVTSRSFEPHGQTDLAVFGTKVSFDLHCTLHYGFKEIEVTPKLR